MYRAHRKVGFFVSQSRPSAIQLFSVAANARCASTWGEEVVRNAGDIFGATDSAC